MTSPICPARMPIRSNLENRSEINRSMVTIELTTKCVDKVFVNPMTTVENENGVNSIKFQFKVFYKVPIYENLKDVYQKIGGKILSNSISPELFSYSESKVVETESQLTIDLSSKNVTLVVFEGTRSRLNISGTTSLEFKFTTESRGNKNPTCKTLEDGFQKKEGVANESLQRISLPHCLKELSEKSVIDPIYEVFPHQVSSEINTLQKDLVTEESIYVEKVSNENSEQIPPHYLKMNPKKPNFIPIYGTVSQQLSNELPSVLEKDLVTEEPIYEELKAASANSEQISSDREKDPMENPLARSIYRGSSCKSFSRLASIPEEDEEPIYEVLKAADESSKLSSFDGENEFLTKNALARSISDMHFPDAKMPKKSKNPLRKLMDLFGKCIARNPQNNVLIKPIDNIGMQISESPIYDKIQVKKRTISEDSGYDTPLSSPGEPISIRLSDFC
ncbi:MAG: hypothetical protein ACRDAI_07860 [Candidatus Rhabdochlamydia sp.]